METKTSHVLLLSLVFANSLLAAERKPGFAFEQQTNRLVITHSGQPVAEYVFRDDKILRPYFANVHAPGAIKVTRNHPPIAGQDAVDHDTMHPGIALGFGDINGQDFWRNKAVIRHERFLEAPAVKNAGVRFTAVNTLLTEARQSIARQVSRISISARTNGWLLDWDATLVPLGDGFYFGDQEEMGFCARVATPIIEKNGGKIVSSEGAIGAKQTWGQPAKWCDYSGILQGKQAGIMIMPDPINFRPSWWHNRDYGVFVANPFGRKAMTQGETSRVGVKRDQAFRLRFGVFLHSSSEAIDPAKVYADFVEKPSP